MWVKICGITRLEDAISAARFGADAVGFIFAESPRRVTEEEARSIVRQMPDGPELVGVFADEKIERVARISERCCLDAVQLHGEEDPGYMRALSGAAPGVAVIKVIKTNGRLDFAAAGKYACGTVLFDARNGSRPKAGGKGGGTLDWTSARFFTGKKKVIVAGGLTPYNVAGIVKAARPYGVDVASGIETAPGVKDPVLMYKFIEKARKADYEVREC